MIQAKRLNVRLNFENWHNQLLLNITYKEQNGNFRIVYSIRGDVGSEYVRVKEMIDKFKILVDVARGLVVVESEIEQAQQKALEQAEESE